MNTATTPSVIRDSTSISIDPLVVTTKFDVDHGYDGEGGEAVLAYVDITAALYLSHGDSALKLDFGVFGDPHTHNLEKDYEAEIAALDALANHIRDIRVFLMSEYGAAVTAS